MSKESCELRDQEAIEAELGTTAARLLLRRKRIINRASLENDWPTQEEINR